MLCVTMAGVRHNQPSDPDSITACLLRLLRPFLAHFFPADLQSTRPLMKEETKN